MDGSLVAYLGERTLELQTYPIPTAPPGGAVLEVLRANVCGSDSHIYEGHNPALSRIVLGHEFVARIAELGAGLEADSTGRAVHVGDRVVVVYSAVCMHCEPCARGQLSMCLNATQYAAPPPEQAPHFRGAFGTHYLLNPGQFFYRVPDTLDDEQAAGANCALAQVMFALDVVGLRRGENVVIQGAGGLGLYATSVASAAGAETIVVDADPERLELAREFGASHVIEIRDTSGASQRVQEVLSLTRGTGADVVLEVAGQPMAFKEAMDLIRVGGRVASVGNLSMGAAFEVSIAPAVITRKQARIFGCLRYDPWYLQTAIEFLERHQSDFPLSAMCGAEFSLANAEDAIKSSLRRAVARPAIVPGFTRDELRATVGAPA